MLQSLKIINYALIDSLEFKIPQGFITITGETGAGKSIILEHYPYCLDKEPTLLFLKIKS
ncbi:MAG: AAA family ATPase [Bacteroidales bacterium]